MKDTPLTLRLTAALIDFVGSARTAREQIYSKGARVVEIQKRSEQNEQTSLTRCLALAYETLDADEQRLLYVIASCPGGIFMHQVERYGGTDASQVLGGLRHWSLVQTIDAGVSIERLHVLSPVRSYARQRWAEEHASEAQELEEELLTDFGVMAAVISERSEDVERVPYMVSRFLDELPNLLWIIDEAEAQPENANLSFLGRSICAALMRFFFVARLPEQGVRLMIRGARLAMRDGDWNGASANIAQAVSLMQRGHDQRIAADLESMLDEIELVDPETNGNVAITRAMLANHLAMLALPSGMRVTQ